MARVHIPKDEIGGYKGIAFATFRNTEDAQKVIALGFIKYEFSELPCEHATMSTK